VSLSSLERRREEKVWQGLKFQPSWPLRFVPKHATEVNPSLSLSRMNSLSLRSERKYFSRWSIPSGPFHHRPFSPGPPEPHLDFATTSSASTSPPSSSPDMSYKPNQPDQSQRSPLVRHDSPSSLRTDESPPIPQDGSVNGGTDGATKEKSSKGLLKLKFSGSKDKKEKKLKVKRSKKDKAPGETGDGQNVTSPNSTRIDFDHDRN
jgi:hypothetical protein